jgi:hypothetical protein
VRFRAPDGALVDGEAGGAAARDGGRMAEHFRHGSNALCVEYASRELFGDDAIDVKTAQKPS